MGITATIGGTPFGSLSSADGRYLMSCSTSAGTYKLVRFHPPGTNGNCIIRLGCVGGTLTFRLRYVGILSAILGQMKTDREAYENTAVDVIDPLGTTFHYCNLLNWDPEDPRGIAGAVANRAYVDVVATFSRD